MFVVKMNCAGSFLSNFVALVFNKYDWIQCCILNNFTFGVLLKHFRGILHLFSSIKDIYEIVRAFQENFRNRSIENDIQFLLSIAQPTCLFICSFLKE